MSALVPSPEIASTAVPPLPVDARWDEAFLRVESYLHAHHLKSRVLLNLLSTEIIREAREQVMAHPGGEPVEVAMRITHERIGAWFARAGCPGDWSNEQVRAGGRLALVLADFPGRWGNHFLSHEPMPAELAASLTSGVLKPGPELRFSNMAAAPLEFSFNDPNDRNERKLGSWSVMYAALGWLAVVMLYGAAWAASH